MILVPSTSIQPHNLDISLKKSSFAAYQDLVGILLANGYTVEVTPLHNNTRLQVVIKESEDEVNE